MNIDELRKLAGMPQTEWANSPANTKHPEPEEVQAPEADVNQSLRQYMNADPQPVKVVEGEDKVFEDHEVEDMMAKFKEYLSEDEAVEEQAQEEVVEQATEIEEKKAKPDFADIDGDGDEKESMKKAAKDKEKADESVEETVEENQDITDLKKLSGITEAPFPGEYDYTDPKYMHADGEPKVSDIDAQAQQFVHDAIEHAKDIQKDGYYFSDSTYYEFTDGLDTDNDELMDHPMVQEILNKLPHVDMDDSEIKQAVDALANMKIGEADEISADVTALKADVTALKKLAGI